APRPLRDFLLWLDRLAGFVSGPLQNAASPTRRPWHGSAGGCEPNCCYGSNAGPRKGCRGGEKRAAHNTRLATAIWPARRRGVLSFSSAYSLTLFGVAARVKGMSGWVLLWGGEGDRSQGCTGPRGRTWSEVQTR